MFKNAPFVLWALLLIVLAIPAAATDIVNPGGGVLAHIVGGGPWTTDITLVNLTSISAAYEVHFYGDDGQPMTLATTQGTNSVLTGNLPSGGSIIIETNGPTDAPYQQGWAQVVTAGNVYIAGSAVFRLSLPDTPVYEASLPLDTDAHYLYGLPFIHVDASTGFALVNSYAGTTINVTLTFYDESGTQFFTDSFQMLAGTHQAFMLPDKYPQVAGKTGLVIVSADYYMNVLGLRAKGSGFTTITPLVVQGW